MVIRYGSGFVKYVEVDHNTVFQHNLWEAMTIESTWEAKVTNNIFYNFAFRNRNIQHYSLFEMDSTGTKGTGDFGTYLDEDRVIDFSNNNWYIDPKYGDIISDYSDYLINTFGQDTLMYSGGGAPYPMPYRWILRDGVFANEALLDTQTIWWPLKPKVLHFIENDQVDTVNIFRERLWFDNPPPEWEEYFTAFVNRNWSFAGWTEIPNHWVDEDPVMMNEVDNPYTFRYNDNSRSATAAEDGGPLGDPRWVPYPTVSTEKINTAPKSMVRAYPNPCQEQLSFEITANAASMVRIRIYDLTGKEVLSINENLSQGLNTIPVSLSRISQPGIYMYQVKLTGQANTISTGKLVKR